MANSVQLVCWPTPDRLGLGIQLMNLVGEVHSENEELVQIDTGYSEDILLPYDLFQALNLQFWRLPHSMSPQGTTVTGQVIHFIEAHAIVIIPKTGEQYRIIAQTFAENTRFLIGRSFLRRLKVLLDGPGGQTCLLSPQT